MQHAKRLYIFYPRTIRTRFQNASRLCYNARGIGIFSARGLWRSYVLLQNPTRGPDPEASAATYIGRFVS